MGAASRGPKPRAKTYNVKGRKATVVDTPNCSMIAGTAGEYMDEPRVLSLVRKCWLC